MDNAQSPEKQLLHYIENPAVAQQAAPKAARRPRLRVWPRFFKRQPAGAHKSGRKSLVPAFTVRTLNLLLMLCIAAVVIYLGVSSYVSYNAVEEQLSIGSSVKEVYAATEGADPFKMHDLQFYLAKVDLRDIFQMGPRKKSARAQDGQQEVSSKLMEAAKDLRLVGISWSDNPDVMIEDLTRRVTFFLKQGELMENGVRVRDVFKDRVVLELDGETIDLQ